LLDLTFEIMCARLVGAFPANSPRYGVIDDDSLYISRPCSGNYTNSTGFSLEAKGEWVNAKFHFDDFFNSLLSVFVMTVGGWGDIVLDGLSATRDGYSPSPYLKPNSIIMIYFFVGVTFFGLYGNPSLLLNHLHDVRSFLDALSGLYSSDRIPIFLFSLTCVLHSEKRICWRGV